MKYERFVSLLCMKISLFCKNKYPSCRFVWMDWYECTNHGVEIWCLFEGGRFEIILDLDLDLDEARLGYICCLDDGEILVESAGMSFVVVKQEWWVYVHLRVGRMMGRVCWERAWGRRCEKSFTNDHWQSNSEMRRQKRIVGRYSCSISPFLLKFRSAQWIAQT